MGQAGWYKLGQEGFLGETKTLIDFHSLKMIVQSRNAPSMPKLEDTGCGAKKIRVLFTQEKNKLGVSKLRCHTKEIGLKNKNGPK